MLRAIWTESKTVRQFRTVWEREGEEFEKEYGIANRYSTQGGLDSAAVNAYGYSYDLSDKHYFKLYEQIDGRWVEIADLYTDASTLR